MQEKEKLSNEQSINIIALGQKLNGLGIKAVFKEVINGPIVTGYFFELDHSVLISKVTKRAEDFALALNKDKVIVQRVGGQIAVFIPNEKREVIDYKELLHWSFQDDEVKKMELPLPIGVDFKGNKSAFDLVQMPHILITGSTGSGKSVLESSIICSLCYHLDASRLHLYLVDTKMVDLPLFKNLPQVQLVADSLEKFHNMMSFIMIETRRRLSILQNASCRNIQDYHKLQGDKASLPYIVLILDEFGDLMELDDASRKAGEYEDTPRVKSWLKQATQIGRAAGLHIIAGTQRASVKVIDGDIKTNLPARISLRVPSRVDSQIILGCLGAENLLGRGDMLIQRPETDTINRYHGAFVSMTDITSLVMQYEMLKDIMNK